MPRLLNMKDLPRVRREHLVGQTCIGRGTFASVFASNQESPSVTKVTTDFFGYSFLADDVWHDMREEVDSHFPRVVENHGDVGESRGLTAYMVELERLYPVSTTEHRRRIARWVREYDGFESSTSRNRFRMSVAEICHVKSLEFCAAKSAQEDEPYRQVFGALEDFIGNYGGALDLKRSNFMCRASGDLVWNDVIFDVRVYNRS